MAKDCQGEGRRAKVLRRLGSHEGPRRTLFDLRVANIHGWMHLFEHYVSCYPKVFIQLVANAAYLPHPKQAHSITLALCSNVQVRTAHDIPQALRCHLQWSQFPQFTKVTRGGSSTSK